jgi:uncharacterized membrane protein
VYINKNMRLKTFCAVSQSFKKIKVSQYMYTHSSSQNLRVTFQIHYNIRTAFNLFALRLIQSFVYEVLLFKCYHNLKEKNTPELFQNAKYKRGKKRRSRKICLRLTKRVFSFIWSFQAAFSPARTLITKC